MNNDGNNPPQDAALQLAEELSSIWTEFRPLIFSQMEVIEKAAGATGVHSLDDELRQNAKQEAHRLAGSLGSLGLAQGSQLASEIERILGTTGHTDEFPTKRLANLAVLLRHELETFH